MDVSSVPKAKWTVLYYMDGKNNLANMAQHSFNTLDQVGSDPNVNLVAELGLPKKSAFRGLMTGTGTKQMEEVAKPDMGSSQHLQEFLEWGIKKYPAEHYALVLWDHGAGFMGCCTDDETGHLMTPAQMADALKNAQASTGGRVEVVNFNACLMNQAEVAYEMKGSTDFMVGSEETESGLQIPIPKVMGTTPQDKVARDIKTAAADGHTVNAEELSKLFVFESKNQVGSSLFTPTQSAIDVSKMDAVKDSADRVAGLLLEAMDKDPKLVDQLRKDIKHSQKYLAMDAHVEPYIDYRDLKDFAKVLAKDPKFGPQVAEAAVELQKAVDGAVVSEWHAPWSSAGGRSLDGSNGLSAYIPRDYGFDRGAKNGIDGIKGGSTHGYEKTQWAKDSKWDEMLKKISKDDDYLGRFPKLNRKLMMGSQVAKFYGYEFAQEAAKGAAALPKMVSFPITLGGIPIPLPIPGVVGAAAAVVSSALRVHNGTSQIHEAIKRDDSPNRKLLGVNGLIDTAVGVGSIVTVGALLAGATAVAAPVGIGVLALGIGRLAVNTARTFWHAHQGNKLTVDQKIDAATKK